MRVSVRKVGYAGVRVATIAAAQLLCASGCYQMHGFDSPPVRVDSGGRRDAAFVPAPDAFVPASDGGAVDAGPPACSGFGVVDRLPLEWSDDCGEIREPRAVAQAGGFDVVVSERRTCRDRAPLVFVDHLSTRGGGLDLTLESNLPQTGLEVALASAGDVLGVCSALTYWGLDADHRVIASGRLADDPVGGPGCPVTNRCTGLAATDAGYLVSFEFFECDVVGHTLAVYGSGGALRSTPFTVFEPLRDVTSFDGGWAAVGAPRGSPRSAAKLYRWLIGAAAPEELTIDVEGRDAAVTWWPFASGHLVAAFVADEGRDVVLTTVVFDERGREVSRERIDPFAGTDATNYGASRVHLATTSFGVVAVTSSEWEGGALRSLFSVVAIGADGAALAPPVVESIEGGLLGLDLAAEGERALVHVARSERRTEAVLFGCR